MIALYTDIIVVNGWNGAQNLIKDPVRQNIEKNFMMPLPGFDH